MDGLFLVGIEPSSRAELVRADAHRFHMNVPTRHRIVSGRSWGLLLASFVVVGLCLAGSAWAQAKPQPVNKVKAAFIYQFAKFVEWPDESFESETSSFKIGVLGDDDVVKEIQEVVADKTVSERVVEIRHSENADELRDCHILFVNLSNSREISSNLRRLQNDAILTVGDAEEFTTLHGVIRLYEEGNKVRFEINVDAARRAKLKISSKLLNLAKVVRDEDESRES